MKEQEIPEAVAILKKAVKAWKTPAVTVVAEGGEPFKVLVSCIISLRTQDRTTAEASARLFALADTPQALAGLPEETIARAIYPAGFYNPKAKTLRRASELIFTKF
ncbi:MAG TPA: endonuclease III, partial [Nitrospirota bacterium]